MKQHSVCRQTVSVDLENGLHLVPCSQIAQLARGFDCDVSIIKDAMRVDAKNVFDLMTLNAAQGTVLVLEATGEGASDAISQLVQLFDSKFEIDDSSGTGQA